MMRLALLVLLLLPTPCVAGDALPAPVSAAVEPGVRVRVTLIAREPAPVVGRILEVPGDSILVAADPDSSQRTIPRAAIAKLEVSEGFHSSTLRGAYAGSLLLAIPGAVIGLVAGGQSHSESGTSSMAEGAVAGFAVGAVVGAGVGALLGSFSHHERWKKIEP